MYNIKEHFRDREHFAMLLVFMYPLFLNTLRHWASSMYVLIALLALFSIKKFTYSLNREEKIFLAIIVLHVISTMISDALNGWTRASHNWFFSGDIRFIFAVPIYLYLRRVPEIWKYLVAALPIAAIIIGLTGVIDFSIRYLRGNVDMIFAEGIYGHIFQGNISALLSVLSYAAFEYFKGNEKMRMLCLTGAVLGAIGALVSITRNAWLSLVLLYIITFLLQGGSRKIAHALGMKKIAAITIALITVLYFLSGVEYVSSRFTQVFEEPVEYFNADRSKPMRYTSIGFRLEQWRGVIYAFEDKPIFGHGVGNSGKVHNRYIREGRLNEVIYQEPTEKYGTPSHVHSAYFEYLGDTGIIGFILILLVMFYAPYVAYKSRNNNGLAWKFVFLHGAAFGIASLTEVPFIRNNWTSIFLVFSLVFFVWLMHENDEYHASMSQ